MHTQFCLCAFSRLFKNHIVIVCDFIYYVGIVSIAGVVATHNRTCIIGSMFYKEIVVIIVIVVDISFCS